MRSRIKSWISRYLVDTSIEVQKLRELSALQVKQILEITNEMKTLNDSREEQIADLNNTDHYWRCKEACGNDTRTKD